MPFDYDFPYRSQRMPVMAGNVVATSQPLAAQAGLTMLQRGGNAVDAALAAAICLTVVEPTNNGIGGDAFAMVWDGTKLHGLNGSGRSPMAWDYKHFAHYDHMPRFGWDSITVPGAVSAWVELSRKFGKLPFETLFEPAIGYAKAGFPVSPKTSALWELAVETYEDFPEFSRIFTPKGRFPHPGELFSCPDQAKTLEEIALTSGESFYHGRLAEEIAACSLKEGGLMTAEDLAKHQADWVEPIAINYRGCDLYEIPPNGQGLAALIALGILGHFDLARYPVDSADSLHLQIEAMKLAFADVGAHLADPGYMTISYQELLDPDYLKSRAKLIDMKKAGHPSTGIPYEKGTVYLTAADSSGMMVSYIQSNYWGFGSGVVIPGTGIAMQNRGYGFNIAKGHPNRVDSFKRPFHTIIPALVMKEGRPVMSFGVMGGHFQAQGHIQMMTRIFDFGLNPQAASDAPRWMVTEDGRVAVEAGIKPEVLDELRSRGHNIVLDQPARQFGGAQLIYRLDNGAYVAASDSRKDGQAAGF